MTPEEEELLVQVIVRCVRRVLELREDERSAAPQPVPPPLAPGLSTPSRFVDVVAHTGRAQDGSVVRASSGDRAQVRAALQRFLRRSEERLLASKGDTDASAGAASDGASANGARPAPAAAASGERETAATKRPVITQADVLAAWSRGERVIVLPASAIVTPLARQTAREKGVELR